MSTSVTSPRPKSASDVAAHLEGLEETLVDQLASLGLPAHDEVAAAHRAAVERHLEEVRLALRLHDDGRYGTCIRCADPIDKVRLQVRPWASRCVRCAERFGW